MNRSFCICPRCHQQRLDPNDSLWHGDCDCPEGPMAMLDWFLALPRAEQETIFQALERLLPFSQWLLQTPISFRPVNDLFQALRAAGLQWPSLG